MNAWPMIARCKQAQWNGLPDQVQSRMIEDWKSELGVASYREISHRLVVVWRVIGHGASLDLISIKENIYDTIGDSGTGPT